MALKRLILLGFLAASPSFAATLLYVASTDTAIGGNIWISEDSGVSDKSVYAGGININVGGTNTDGSNGDARVAFCVQLFVNISTGKTYDTVIDPANNAPPLTPTNAVNLERAAWLINNYWPSATAQGKGTLVQQGEGLQLAIWDLMEDNGDGFSSGKLRAASNGNTTNATVLADAQGYEAAALAGTKVGLAYIYIDTTTAKPAVAAQDLISDTPEPSSILLICGGLALIGLSRLRRQRRAPR